jgi:hypothetical protein
MTVYQDAQHLCARVPGGLCSFPSYCARSGCLNEKPPAQAKAPDDDRR